MSNLAQIGHCGFLDIVVVKPLAELCRARNLFIAFLETFVSRVVSKAVLPRLSLNDIRTLVAKSFVSAQGVDYFAWGLPFEENCQRYAVFDRLIGALSEVGKQHRLVEKDVRCPRRQWLAIYRPHQKQVSTFSSNPTTRGSHPSKDAASSSRSPIADHNSIVSSVVGTKPT